MDESNIYQSRDWYIKRGKTQYRRGNIGYAITNFTIAIEANPDDAPLYYERALAYAAKDDYEHAKADYTAAITRGYDTADVCLMRGIASNHLREYDSAIADYTEAIRRDPDCSIAYFNRALLYFDEVGDCDHAIRDYTEVIVRRADDRDAYYGFAYRAKAEYESAIADFTQALRIDPMDTKSYYHRADTFKRMGQRDAAIADLKVYVQLEADPRVRYWGEKMLEEFGSA